MLQGGDETPYIVAAYMCLYVSNWNSNLFSLLCSILDIELNFTVSSVYLDPRDPTCFQFHIIVSRRESWQHIGIRAGTIRQIGILHARCSQYIAVCNTDVVIVKPETGRARICSASLKLQKVTCLKRKGSFSTFTFQWSSSSSHNTRNMLQYIALRNILACWRVLNCIALCCIAILLHIDIVTALVSMCV